MKRIEQLFPPGVICLEADPEHWQLAVHCEEEALITSAVAKRQGEFRAGRHAAHAALAGLNRDCAVLGRDQQRRPHWPEGVVGSISHTQNCALAAVALKQDFAAIGLDVEQRERLDPSLIERICSQEEQTKILLSGLDPIVIFSAKEALYKMLNPLFGWKLDFHEVELDWSAEGDLTALVKSGMSAKPVFDGRFRLDKDLVFSAFWLNAR